MKTSTVDGFKFRDKNETGDGDLFESFTGLALASSENADKTILENPETKNFWIGQKSVDMPIKGIKHNIQMDNGAYVTLQIRREPGGARSKSNKDNVKNDSF